MAIRNFTHRSAASLKEAALLSRPPGNAVLMAGGTDLRGVLKDNIHPAYPELLVDLVQARAEAGAGASREARHGGGQVGPTVRR